jgi:hypothetical protein
MKGLETRKIIVLVIWAILILVFIVAIIWGLVLS